jgi:phosphoribosylanthranilate isomerase
MIKGIKICGISDPKTLNYIINHAYPPKFIGFVTNFKKSKRFVHYSILKKLLNIDKKNINFVSVLVNPNDKILEKIKDMKFDYYQLYNVAPERTMEIKRKYKKKIISALTVFNKEDVDKYKKYREISEIILFDGKGYEKSIGFDHKLLNNLPSSLNKMIAGNIKIDDIPNFKNKEYFIDLSGGLENNYGKKDLKKINKLLNLVAKI